MSLPKAVRLVTFAWGEQHVKDMLNYALASALAPGNLPVIARRFDCTVAVVTEAGLFDLVRTSETGRRIQEICTLKLIAMDDLLAEPWQYGMTLTRALFRGMEDLGSAMTETYFLFLNADFILSDGCYERLVPRIEAGERLHLSPSYCTVEEVLAPILLERLERGTLRLPPRELAGLILQHRHNTIKAKTVNQDMIEFEHADQFYWGMDENTLLGHQMPIAVVGMQPAVALEEPGTFWDWGLIYDFCPDKRLCVIGDSDEFLMLEMRPQMRSAEHILLGRSPPKSVARRMTGYITQYQVDNARFPLSLHATDLPVGVDDAREHLKGYVDTVLGNLPRKPIEHGNHAQWLYHKKYFRERLEKRYLAHLRDRDLYLPKRRKSPAKHLESSYVRESVPREEEFLNRIAGIGNLYHSLVADLREASAQHRTPRVLAICDLKSPLLRFLDGQPGLQTHLAPGRVLDGALDLWPKGSSKFELCFVEPPTGPLAAKAAEVLETVLPHIAEGGRISLFWYAALPSNPQVMITAAIKLMMRNRFDVEFRYGSSPFARVARRGMRVASGFSRWGRSGRFLRAFAMAAVAALLGLAALSVRFRRRQPTPKSIRTLDARCVGLILSLRPSRQGSSAGMYMETPRSQRAFSANHH